MKQFQFHDLHVHTRPHSPDAHRQATLPAMLERAARNGVQTVGLANHYFPATKFETFQKLRQEVVRDRPPGLSVLVGAEVCVLDTSGGTILTDAEARQLDFVLAGPHHFRQRWVEQPPRGDARDFVGHQHQMLLSAASNPLIDGLAHPWVISVQHAPQRWGFSLADFLAIWTEDYFAELGAVAHEHNTALEIGMGIHLMARHQGDTFWQAYARGLQAARANGAKFYFGSDAHHLFVVARLDWLRPTLSQLDFGPGDIITGFGRKREVGD
jgi:histidinol phosphatase-like PHP family hydrolase